MTNGIAPELRETKTDNSVFPIRLKDIKHQSETENIYYIWDKTPHLLEEYFDIRESAYSESMGLKHFDGHLDASDICDHVLLMMDGGQCCGGIRLTVYKSLFDNLLPMEKETFRLREILPEFELTKNQYAELSRFALMPKYRTGSHSKEMTQLAGKRATELGVKYLFAVAPLMQARWHKKLCPSWLSTIIFDNIAVPDKLVYEGMEMKLMVFINHEV